MSQSPNVAIVDTFCNCFNRQYLWSHLPSEIRFTDDFFCEATFRDTTIYLQRYDLAMIYRRFTFRNRIYFDADEASGVPGKVRCLVAIGYLVGNCQVYVNGQSFILDSLCVCGDLRSIPNLCSRRFVKYVQFMKYLREVSLRSRPIGKCRNRQL